MNETDGAEFRCLLREVVAGQLDGREQVALLFSGGTDSLTVLWTLLDLGADVSCHVFRLRSVRSADSKVARIAADAWNVPLAVVVPPEQSLTRLARNVGQVVRLIGSSRKTHVEVMWACWHLFRNVGRGLVFTGLQADTLYGSSRSMAIRCSKMTAASFAARRRELLARPGQEGLAQARRLAAGLGKELCVPYADEKVRDFILRFPWRELNRPRQKMPAVLGFKQEFRRVPVYRRNDNLQCGSGVREHMARLRGDPAINKRGWKSMAKLYEDLGRSVS